MPVTPTYPGVYIEEVPSGVRTITGVATSVAAFVDGFARGPLNEAIQVLSFADFEREFGGLSARSEASYGIQQFFLNGGAEAWVVRTGAGALAPASAVLGTGPAGGGDPVLRATAGRRIRGGAVPNPGRWGNALRIEIDYDTTDPAELFNLTVSEVDLQAGRLAVRQTETYRNLTMRAGVPNNAADIVNEGSRLVQLSRDAAWPALPDPVPAGFRPAATGTLGNPLNVAPSIPPTGTTFNVNAGAGNRQVQLDYGTAPVPTDYPGLRPFLEAAIRAADPNDPLLAGATAQLWGNGTAASPYRFRILAGRGAAPFNPATTLAFSGAGANGLGLNAAPNNQQYALAGGADGDPPGPAELRGSPAAKSGLYALEDVSTFNILCIPRAAELGPVELRAVYAEAAAYCEERRAFLLVDVPRAVADVAAMVTWLSQNDGLRHRNAAVYFPRHLIADPLNGFRLRNGPASGTVAGLYARVDVDRGVWKAPAGTEARLRNVQDLAYLLTDAENGVLNPLGVNCLRVFPVFGNVCWGARTLDGSDQQASEWKYVPVRRLALFLEESLYRGTQWVVFEPNDEPLWAQIRLNVGAFLQTLFRQGAFQGRTPREAYFVKCDQETTTQADIDRGIVNVVVGFAPVKPAEFVILRIQQMAGQNPT